jgi:hypothetical protein
MNIETAHGVLPVTILEAEAECAAVLAALMLLQYRSLPVLPMARRR